jgi:hypothetical protein
VLHQPFARHARELLRAEDAGTIRLKLAHLFERGSEFFVGRCHVVPDDRT